MTDVSSPQPEKGLTSYQPSLAPVLEQHFLANFISFFDKVTPNSKPLQGWFGLLPSMLSNTIRSYVRAPILAASLALYGTLAQEQAIVLIAYKWYGVGLNRQRKRIVDSSKREQSMIPTVEDISMALLSAYFEVFFSTNSEAYFHHQIGASKLLEARGPEACQTGVLHELFQTVRFHMIFVTIITHKPSIFATEEWLTIPFAQRSKTLDDRVVDVLTVMPETLLSSGITGISATSSTAYEHGFEFSYQASSFISQLEALWPEVEALLTPTELNYDDFEPSTRDDLQLSRMWRCTPTGFNYPDLLTATTIAFYHLAWILILSPICGSEFGRQRYADLIMAHCASILAVATFVDGNNNGSVYHSGCSYLRRVFPLRIICLISPSLMQRESARYRLERWRTDKGMGGICAVALVSSESQDWQLNLDQI
ncbi:hypothetical protein MMC18_008435 [Xylographa bjoerkii]|nr:hypothetical protein [Xylographa bjoerkii]